MILKKNSFFLLGCLLCLAAPLSAQDEGLQLNKMGQTLFYLQRYYLDTVNVGSLMDKALIHMIEELDPHSTFIPAKDVQAMNEPLQGNFDGIGIEFNIIADSLVVVAPIAGGPSEAVGLRASDRIIAVDDTVACNIGLTTQKVHGFLRGPKGSKVRLDVKRRGVKEILRFEVTRDKIPLNSLDAAYEAAPGIAYVRLSRFAQSSMTEFIEAFEKFDEMPKGVILDLRGNSGGYMFPALQIAEQFLEKDQLIVYTEGRHMSRHNDVATRDGFFVNTPVVLLIDENSASSSEILAGALQDWDRAILIGRRSFGKGLVQQGLPLADGSQIRLTVARYHTPTGRVIQTPYHLGDKEGYYQNFVDRYVRGEQFSQDSIRVLDSLSYYTLKEKRKVYGGGGIMPDIFIPQDTTGYTPYWSRMIRMGLVTEFMGGYIDSVRADLSKQYRDFNSFNKNYALPDAAIQGLVAYAETKGLPASPESLAISGDTMRLQMKALVARTLFDTSAYFQILNERGDAAYDKALEALQQWARYSGEYLKAPTTTSSK
jgi:C-terminal peptidase (prc)